ncbi:hypothetical protein IX51_05065 [uncultured archaeon]|nr:hypothetical protein IX51_05065 [uncultured archaeon]HKJ96906.1 helix-turn-helix domain-containing protein [Thermoplasmataceae archaeon]
MKSNGEGSGVQVKTEFCPIVEAIRQIGGEWNMIVVRYLLDKPMGFNEILRNAKGMNSKTLSRVLKNLQGRSIVDRKIVSTQPFSVEYSLTEKGAALHTIMDELKRWGEVWVLSQGKQGTGPLITD